MPNNKTTAAIAFLLILTFAISIVAIPTANAHDPPWTIISYAYITAGPNPVGVGQRTLILMWIDGPMPGATVGNDIRRINYTLTITDPNGKTETMHWDTIADPTSCQFVSYAPDTVGTYTLKFDYGGQKYTWSGAYQNDVFTAASKTMTLTVQEEPLPEPKNSYPLPTEYWTRPIEGQNTAWYTISSNWLGEPYITSGAAIGGGTSGNYFARIQPDGAGPNSAHIMWSKPIQDGGVVGGNSTGVPGEMYYTGGSYNTRFSNALIMNGRLYYDEPYGNSGSGGDYVCVDLRTGEEIWRTNTTGIGAPSFGYLYAFDNPNQHGILPNGLLFTTNFARSYDPRTGRVTTMNVTNVPSVDTPLAQVVGPNGEILRYRVTNIGNATNPNWRLTQWNSSKVVGYESGTGVGGWYSGTIDGGLASRYDWNISITLPNSASWRVDRVSYDNIMLLVQGSFGGHPTASFGTVSFYGANVTAISLKPASRGTVLWTKNFPPAENNITRSLANWDPERGIFIIADKETSAMYGYSLSNGEKLWGPTEPTNDYSYFRTFPAVAYGKIYFAGYGGVLYCYDITDGKLLWTYGNGGPGNSTFGGLEISYGHYPIFIDVIADGKVYLGTTEHSPNSPLYKDARYRCINATDGTEIWTLMGWGTGMDATYDRVADGFFVFLNCYDMQIYCVGKGPSATTVAASPKVSVQGSSVLIEGTVMDIAAGTKQKEQVARFPNGVPAVSDESMNGWMEYVYMQKPRPADIKGVEVTLSVIDSNNNYREIGTTTSDADGFFSYQWTPDIPGKYKVIASFAGSESYWPSHAETAFAVDPAPEATPEPTPTPASMADLYFMPMSIGLIVAIVAVGAVLAILMLRKRP
ncbi:PQQ-binding-like beta-propeller repeat protein [Candidatus Bathyarchaeota archaeon A05DMB-2]|nr:PQQ-binding-like beta-propeller repeat protein [Candidatus Bathyarchaeota archaeon A05DMB-2]